MTPFKPFIYKNHKIRMSGKRFIKVIDLATGCQIGMRVTSIEAAKALVNSRGRVMTKEEYALVHPTAR